MYSHYLSKFSLLILIFLSIQCNDNSDYSKPSENFDGIYIRYEGNIEELNQTKIMYERNIHWKFDIYLNNQTKGIDFKFNSGIKQNYSENTDFVFSIVSKKDGIYDFQECYVTFFEDENSTIDCLLFRENPYKQIEIDINKNDNMIAFDPNLNPLNSEYPIIILMKQNLNSNKKYSRNFQIFDQNVTQEKVNHSISKGQNFNISDFEICNFLNDIDSTVLIKGVIRMTAENGIEGYLILVFVDECHFYCYVEKNLTAHTCNSDGFKAYIFDCQEEDFPYFKLFMILSLFIIVIVLTLIIVNLWTEHIKENNTEEVSRYKEPEIIFFRRRSSANSRTDGSNSAPNRIRSETSADDKSPLRTSSASITERSKSLYSTRRLSRRSRSPSAIRSQPSSSRSRSPLSPRRRSPSPPRRHSQISPQSRARSASRIRHSRFSPRRQSII